MPIDVQVASTTDSAEKVTKATGDFKVEFHEVADVSESSAPLEETQAAKATAPTSEVVETEEALEAKETDEESDDSKDATEDTDENKGKKKKGGYQRRVDKLTKQKAEAQREVEFWRAKALEGQKPAGDQKVEVKPAIDTSKKPKAEDFEKHDDYVEALTDWKLDQKLGAEKAQAREQLAKAEQKTQLKTHLERVIAFEKSHPDFKEVMEDIGEVRLSMAVNNAIIDSEHGPELMYEFAKNPGELERLNALSPESAARAIGRLEAKFESSAEKAKETTTTSEKKVTTAPKPISTINSKAGHTKSTRDELPYDEWVKLRRTELRGG